MADTAKVTLALDIDRGEFTKGISDVQRQLQGLAKQPLSFRERLAGLGTGQRVGIGGGIAVGAIDFLSSGLRLAGVSDNWTKSMSEAASSARQFGTMLAPLGPIAAGAGSAMGALVGALKGYTESRATQSNPVHPANPAILSRTRGRTGSWLRRPRRASSREGA